MGLSITQLDLYESNASNTNINLLGGPQHGDSHAYQASARPSAKEYGGGRRTRQLDSTDKKKGMASSVLDLVIATGIPAPPPAAKAAVALLPFPFYPAAGLRPPLYDFADA